MATPEARLTARMQRLDAESRLAARLSKLGDTLTPEQQQEGFAKIGIDTRPEPHVTVGAPRPVGVPQTEVARLAGEGNVAANLTVGASDQATRTRLRPVAAAARASREPVVSRAAEGLVNMTVAPIQRAVFSPSVGEARPDPRLSKGGNAANVPLNQPPYDAEHGAVTGTERALAGVQAGMLAAAPALPLPFAKPAASAVGRVVQGTVRNAIVGAAVNAPIEAAKSALEAEPGQRLTAAGKGLVRGAATGAAAGGVLGGVGGAIGETMAAMGERRLAARLSALGDTPKAAAAETPVPAPELEASPLAPEKPETAPEPKPAPEPPPEPPLAPEGTEERFSGPGLTAKAKEAVKTAYRSALVTPYAEIERQAPALADALTNAGAAPKRAEHIATRRLERVYEGLEPWQRGQFGTKLVLDNMDAEAAKKTQQAADLRIEHAQSTVDALRGKLDDEAQRLQRQIELMPGNQRKRYALMPELDAFRDQIKNAKTKADLQALADERFAKPLEEAADRFQQHGTYLANRVNPGIETTPWFQRALATYKADIETPLRQSALGSGVAPADLRKPTSAYVKLVSEQRAQDEEIRRALDIAGVKSEAELRRRPALLRKVIGENPELQRYFALNAPGPRQGPIPRTVGPQGSVPSGPRAQLTGSATQALGTAESYVTDLPRILQIDAPEKVRKAANNQILAEVRKAGRELEPGEAPQPGLKVLAFDDTKGLTTGESGVHRFEVTPEVANAVRRYHRGGEPASAGFRGVKAVADIATRAQISGMPVEATSHANTLSSIVASVPGEKDIAGKALAAIPGPGAKVAAIRDLLSVDFSDPATRALENRLADIGALRIEQHRGGLVNSSHAWLFGSEGVDARGRLVLARKYLARKPNATDSELREFVTSKLGNYIAENSGALPNFMAKGSLLSPFSRFQSARIPTAVKATFGQSGLPATSGTQRARDVANTLYRGPVGHVAGAQLLNRALTGKGTSDNEPGHELDVNTGLAASPGKIGRATGAEGEAPLYLPAATLSPIVYAGLRATGLRSLLFANGTPASGKGADAVRDVANVVFGTAGPFARAIMIAATGTTPYLQRDGTFMRVAPRKFDKNNEIASNMKAAFGQANPALHAFAASSGDAAGSTLATALEQPDKPFGGPASIAARVAEFTMPRVLSPGIGGRTNEQSVESQLTRSYRDALAEYKRRVQRTLGPKARQAIVDEAAKDAEAAGFDPQAVVVALGKTEAQDKGAVQAKADQARKHALQRIRGRNQQ